MEIITSCIIFILIFFCAAFLVGLLFAVNMDYQDLKGFRFILHYYMIGFGTMLAIFELLCVPMSILQWRLHILIYSYTTIIVVLCLISLYRSYRYRLFVFLQDGLKKTLYHAIPYIIIAIVIIGIQLFFVGYYQSNWMSNDDMEYVTRTSTSLFSDYIVTRGSNFIDLSLNPRRSFNSWEIFIAWLCKLSGINASTMVHTVLNESLVMVVFCVFYLVGAELFEDITDRFIFLSIVAFANLFGLYSHYSLTFRILMTMWQGKAVFMAIVLQFTIYYLLRISREDYRKIHSLILMILSLSACSLTPTGVGMFLGVVAMILGLICLAKKRLIFIKYLLMSSIFPMIYLVGYLCFRS